MSRASPPRILDFHHDCAAYGGLLFGYNTAVISGARSERHLENQNADARLSANRFESQALRCRTASLVVED